MRRRLAYQCGALSDVPRLDRLTFPHPGCDTFDLNFHKNWECVPASPASAVLAMLVQPAQSQILGCDCYRWLDINHTWDVAPEVLAIKIQCRSTWNTYEMTGSQRCRGDTTGLLITKRRWSEFVMRGPVWIAVRMYRRPSGSESIGSGNSRKLGTLCFVNHIAVIYSSLALNLVSLGGWFISSNVPSARVRHPSGSWTQRSGFGHEEGVPNFAVSTTAGLATEVLGRTGANL